MTLTPRIVIATLLSVAPLIAEEAHSPVQGGYSTEPLARAVFDPAFVAVDAVNFNNWLTENIGRMTWDSAKGPREHLFYLIDSWVKSHSDGATRVWPDGEDALLAMLFSWAEPLGVHGGSQIHNALKPADMPAAEAILPIPSGFEVDLRNDTLVLSTDDWSVPVPFYFMIWRLQDLQPRNGPRTTVAVISTGAAKHEGVEGHSQSTLMLLYGPGASGPGFSGYWLPLNGFDGTEPLASTESQLRPSRRRFDAENRIRFEIVEWATDAGAYVLVYSGVEGPYEWNRPHFLDFLRALETEPTAVEAPPTSGTEE